MTLFLIKNDIFIKKVHLQFVEIYGENVCKGQNLPNWGEKI